MVSKVVADDMAFDRMAILNKYKLTENSRYPTKVEWCMYIFAMIYASASGLVPSWL